MTTQRIPPIWVLGLSGGSFGLIGGLCLFVIPQALAGWHVPEPTIAAVTAMTLAPGFYSFLFSPILDVGFSRRTYATGLYGITAILAGWGILRLGDTDALKVVLTVAYLANQLGYGALGGWLSSVCPPEQENRLAAWLTFSNIGGFGLLAIFGGALLQSFAPAVSAVLIAVIVILPLVTFPFIPCSAPDQRLASESFRMFARDIGQLLSRRQVLQAILLFAAPCATFSLTNMLAGFGEDFHTSSRLVGLMGGVGAMAAGAVGSLLLPALARRVRLVPLYLGLGIMGSLFTLVVFLLPRSPASFLALAIGENAFQSCAIACSTAITFQTIGVKNPLAATNYAVLIAAYGVPISYMLVVDGWGYGRWGIGGALLVDAMVGAGACLLLLTVSCNCGRMRYRSTGKPGSQG